MEEIYFQRYHTFQRYDIIPFKGMIPLQIKKALTPNFQNIHFSTLYQGQLLCIASVMQELPTLQNTPLPNRQLHFARI